MKQWFAQLSKHPAQDLEEGQLILHIHSSSSTLPTKVVLRRDNSSVLRLAESKQEGVLSIT